MTETGQFVSRRAAFQITPLVQNVIWHCIETMGERRGNSQTVVLKPGDLDGRCAQQLQLIQESPRYQTESTFLLAHPLEEILLICHKGQNSFLLLKSEMD